MSMQQRLQIAELNDRDSGEPDWLFVQMIKITEGKSIKDIAENYCVTYGVLRNWIAASPDRERQYLAAVRYRDEFAKSMGRP